MSRYVLQKTTYSAYELTLIDTRWLSFKSESCNKVVKIPWTTLPVIHGGKFEASHTLRKSVLKRIHKDARLCDSNTLRSTHSSQNAYPDTDTRCRCDWPLVETSLEHLFCRHRWNSRGPSHCQALRSTSDPDSRRGLAANIWRTR